MADGQSRLTNGRHTYPMGSAGALAHPLLSAGRGDRMSCRQQLAGAGAGFGVSCSAPPLAVDREQAPLNDSDSATARTVRQMVRHITAGASDPEVLRWVALSQVYLPAGASAYARAWCWFWWVKSHVRFVSDEDSILRYFGESEQLELLISPAVMVRMDDPAGDCDDFSMLVCAGLAAMGLRCEVVTVAARPDDPGIFSHVFARVEVGRGRWLAMDASHGDRPGWEVPPERQYRRVVWGLDGSRMEVETMAGYNGLHGYDRVTPIPAQQVARENLGAHSGLVVRAGSAMPYGRVHLARRARPGMGDAITGEAPAAPQSWQDVFKSLALTGGSILQQQLAPLNPGEYVQTATGVRAREVPGAVPGSGYTLSTASTGSMWPLLAVAGVGLVLVVAMQSKRR